MSKTICATVQQELDELTLSEDCGVAAAKHLAECANCRDFQTKQTKLRQIVGSLGTVSAPADFEYRLRSRLARDNGASPSHFANLWSSSQRSAAVATAVVLLIGGAILFGQLMKRNTTPAVVRTVQPTNTAPAPVVMPVQSDVAKNQEPTLSNDGVPARQNIGIKRIVSGPSRTKRNVAAVDLSGSAAPVIRDSQSVSTSESVFPIDAAQQSLKVSLLDGQGNRRTISVPTVTFGSQRVVPTTTSFVPKGVW